MDRKDCIHLLRPGVPGLSEIWADLGCGRGAFTFALAEILGPESTIYAVDQDRSALNTLEANAKLEFPEYKIVPMLQDISNLENLPKLDGVVMANALHFVPDQIDLLKKIKHRLVEKGNLVVVEYEVRRKSRWVPFPLPVLKMSELAKEAGFDSVEKVGSKASTYHGVIYSCVCC